MKNRIRKKDDGNGFTGKKEKRETKEKILRCGERRYEEVGANKTDVENRAVRRKMIHCGYP